MQSIYAAQIDCQAHIIPRDGLGYEVQGEDGHKEVIYQAGEVQVQVLAETQFLDVN